MTARALIDLQAGDLFLQLDPKTGGAIAALRFRGIDLLRPVRDPRVAAQRGRQVAAYPLIPYANRIAWGRFTFNGQNFQLARNFGDHPHTIHGNAWMHPWSVIAAQGRHARLVFDNIPDRNPAAEWPFAYRAEQMFDLAEDAVTITLALRNTDSRPWPAGLGLHPYVVRTPEATLRFVADTVWTTGADALPDRREAANALGGFDDGRLLGADVIDSCYAGWGGSAAITLPEAGLHLTLSAMPPMDHLQLYTPAGQNYIGLEPVTNMPDAINRMDSVADNGLVILQPGETLSATVTLGVRMRED